MAKQAPDMSDKIVVTPSIGFSLTLLIPVIGAIVTVLRMHYEGTEALTEKIALERKESDQRYVSKELYTETLQLIRSDIREIKEGQRAVERAVNIK